MLFRSRDLAGVLGDPSEHLVHAARAVDQPLHGEEGVIAHLLMNEVPGLLLAMVVMGVLLVVLRGQVRGLGVRVVVLLEGLVVRPVPVETALVEGGGGGLVACDRRGGMRSGRETIRNMADEFIHVSG